MDALKMAEDLKKNELRKQFLSSFKADIQKKLKWVNSGFGCIRRCRYQQAPRPLAFRHESHRENSPARFLAGGAATLGMSFEEL